MSPWTIIGWIVLGTMALIAAVAVIVRIRWIAARLALYARHVRTRNTPPAAGQRWDSATSYSRYFINRVCDNGRIVMECGCASWSDSPDEWRERVRASYLYLLGADK